MFVVQSCETGSKSFCRIQTQKMSYRIRYRLYYGYYETLKVNIFIKMRWNGPMLKNKRTNLDLEAPKNEKMICQTVRITVQANDRHYLATYFYEYWINSSGEGRCLLYFSSHEDIIIIYIAWLGLSQDEINIIISCLTVNYCLVVYVLENNPNLKGRGTHYRLMYVQYIYICL